MDVLFTQDMKELLLAMEDFAVQTAKQIDYETLRVVPLDGVPKSWPEGDNAPQDPEQAGWDNFNE